MRRMQRAEIQARMSFALPTTGPVGRPVGDPPSGSNEMARVVPGSIGVARARVGLEAVARRFEQAKRLRRAGADDRPQLRAPARRDRHRPGHRQAPARAVVAGDDRALDPLDHEGGDHRRGRGAGAVAMTAGGATGSGRTISSPSMLAAASEEAMANGRQ